MRQIFGTQYAEADIEGREKEGEYLQYQGQTGYTGMR